MPITTFEATVKGGQISLPDNLELPDNTKVYVVIPGVGNETLPRLRSPRLVDPQDIVDFQKQVLLKDTDADL